MAYVLHEIEFDKLKQSCGVEKDFNFNSQFINFLATPSTILNEKTNFY